MPSITQNRDEDVLPYSTTRGEAIPSITQNRDEDVLSYSNTRGEAMASIIQNKDKDLLHASSEPSTSLKNSSFTKVGSIMELRSKQRNDSFVHLKKKDILEEMEDISNQHKKNDDSSRKGRGVTKLRSCLPPKGEIWTVVFFQGQPVCDKGEKLKRALGCYARSENYFPLAKMWRDNIGVEAAFDNVFKEISKNYNFVDATTNDSASLIMVRHYCKLKIQRLLCDHRYRLKARNWAPYVRKEMSVPYVNPVKGLPNDSWNPLNTMWRSNEKMDEMIRNMHNRTMRQLTHYRGTISMARHHFEIEKLFEGEKLDRANIYLDYYKHPPKSASYSCKITKELCEDVYKCYQQISFEDKVNGSLSSSPDRFKKAISSIHGPHHGGYERGFGHGALSRRIMIDSTTILNDHPTQTQQSSDHARLNSLEDKIGQIEAKQDQIVASQAKTEQLLSTIISQLTECAQLPTQERKETLPKGRSIDSILNRGKGARTFNRDGHDRVVSGMKEKPTVAMHVWKD